MAIVHSPSLRSRTEAEHLHNIRLIPQLNARNHISEGRTDRKRRVMQNGQREDASVTIVLYTLLEMSCEKAKQASSILAQQANSEGVSCMPQRFSSRSSVAKGSHAPAVVCRDEEDGWSGIECGVDVGDLPRYCSNVEGERVKSKPSIGSVIAVAAAWV